jgi:hypothetical protein
MNRADLESRLSHALQAKDALLSEDRLSSPASAEARLRHALDADQTRLKLHRRWAGPLLAAAAVLAVAAGTVVALRAGGHDDQPAMTPSPTPRASQTTATTGTPSTASSGPSASKGRTASTGASSPRPLVNERLPESVRAEIVAAFVSARGFQPSWISGTKPGSVYYAYDPDTDTYLAWATFKASAQMPSAAALSMQDAGSFAALKKADGGQWKLYDICTTPAFVRFIGGLPAVFAPC